MPEKKERSPITLEAVSYGRRDPDGVSSTGWMNVRFTDGSLTFAHSALPEHFWQWKMFNR